MLRRGYNANNKYITVGRGGGVNANGHNLVQNLALANGLANGVLFGIASGGETEKKIFEIADQYGKTFDDARRMAPQLGLANARNTRSFDYSLRNVREREMERARIVACDDDLVVYDARRWIRKIMKCDENDDLDAKRGNLRMVNCLDIIIAFEQAIDRLFEFNKNVMSDKDQLQFREQGTIVKRRFLLDVRRVGDPEKILSLIKQYIDIIFDPKYGITIHGESVDKHGGRSGYVMVNKNLVENYDNKFRNRLSRSDDYENMSSGSYSLYGACMAYNVYVIGGEHDKCNEKDDSAHGLAAHWCIRCGPAGRHPEVCCPGLRASFKPVAFNTQLRNAFDRRPHCGISRGRGGGPRGRGYRGFGRGRRYGGPRFYRHMGDRQGDEASAKDEAKRVKK